MRKRMTVLALACTLFATMAVAAAPRGSVVSGVRPAIPQGRAVVEWSASPGVFPAPSGALPRPDQEATPAALGDVDSFIAQVMKDWKVPGLALAVVRDGKVILLKGYGLRDMEKNLPVTPQTLFAIGSITKSFTVTTLGTLVDAGKLDWDKPVRDYLPGFTLHDEVLTEHLTPRDMVTHRSGLPRHDLVWYSSDFSRKDLVYRLRFLEPSKDLRMTFQYNNLMFMTAGYLAGQLMGTTWEEAVRQRVLGPLGMTHTNLSVVDSPHSPDFAEPYKKDRVEGKEVVKLVPFHNIDQIGPAGSINSCVEDMARYLLFHMNKGNFEGKQLLSENNALQMQTPQMVIQGEPQFKERGTSSYGMGFFISTYRGHTMVYHGGAIDGFTANFSFLPQDNVGVVVLTDLDGNPLPTIVANNVFDRLLGLDQVPWNQRYLDIEKKGKEGEEAAKKGGYTQPVPGTHPSHELKDYVGQYENPGYGIVTIAQEGAGAGNDFEMTLNTKLHSPLRHFHYDIWQVPENELDPLQKVLIAFHTDVKGNISSLSGPFEPNVKEIVFTRVPEKRMREKSFLEPFTGQYEVPGTVLTVSLQGDDTLVISAPGQPTQELVPDHGTTFNVKSLSGVSVEFKQDAAGKVTDIVIYQPGGTAVFKKKQ
jgi:CubicO group peptidase (beta-lactamase class C family)